MVESDLVLEKKKKKKTLEKHFVTGYVGFLQQQKKKKKKKNDSGMNFVSHQNSCFAPLSDFGIAL